jgi:hypothetical protein
MCEGGVKNMCFLRGCVLALFTAFVFHADAVSMFTQLDPHNLDEQSLGFAIKIETNGMLVHFEISAHSRNEKLTQYLTATLEVFDSTNQVASCSLEKESSGKGVVYEFDVSPQYLAQSKFTFGNMAESNGRPMPAGDMYWFYLADFIGKENTDEVGRQSTGISKTDVQAVLDSIDNALLRKDAAAVVAHYARNAVIKATVFDNGHKDVSTRDRGDYQRTIDAGFKVFSDYTLQREDVSIEIAADGKTAHSTFTVIEKYRFGGDMKQAVSTESVSFVREDGQVVVSKEQDKTMIK